MAGRGRGRGLTLPAWMTASEAEGSSQASEEPSVAQVNTMSNDQYQDASPNPEIHRDSVGAYVSSHVQDNSTVSQNTETKVASAAPPLPPGPPPMGSIPGYPHMPLPGGIPSPYSGAASAVPTFMPPPMMASFAAMGMPRPPMGMGMGMPPMMHPSGYHMGMGMPPMMATSTGQSGGTQTVPTPAPAPAAVQPATFNDPNNDVKNWSEHEGDDGRTYWHNRATKKSTYDKPECLKCPEERSIPPCKWKEYSADGKIYYSDGTDSSWTMPDEFKEWKERVSGAVARRKAQLEAQAAAAASAANSSQSSIATSGASAGTGSSSRGKTHEAKKSSAPAAAIESQPAIVYASKEEANEAFRALLDEFGTSSTMKFKDVQDMCSKDDRWGALKTVGERKQFLAEYQTKKMKIEKEEKKVHMRKARDSFFQLLAECVEIDARSRWRECSLLLTNDRRFQDVENDRDREEYFDDFVSELAKKERNDREKVKREAKTEFDAIVKSLMDSGAISVKSRWADVKTEHAEVLENARCVALDDTDRRRFFQEYMDSIEAEKREVERKERKEKELSLEDKKKAFKDRLMELIASSEIDMNSRWRDVTSLVDGDDSFIELNAFVKAEPTLSRKSEPRDVFDALVGDMKEELRMDKRVVRDFFDQEKINIEHDTAFESILSTVSGILGEKKSSSPDMIKLEEIVTSRQKTLETIFEEIHQRKVEEHKEEARQRQKREDRYLDLLDDYYYRSDHVDVEWEEAKRELERHSAYRDLGRSDRRTLFEAHMDELRAKLKKYLPAASTERRDEKEDDVKHDEKRSSSLKRKVDEASSISTGKDSRGKHRSEEEDDGSESRGHRSHTSKKSRRDRSRESVERDRGDESDKRNGDEQTRDRHKSRRDDDDEEKRSHRSSKKRSHRGGDESDDNDDDTASRSGKSRKSSKKDKKDKKEDKDRDKEKKHHRHKHKKDRSPSRSHDRRSHRSKKEARSRSRSR